jgi:Transcriptional regulator
MDFKQLEAYVKTVELSSFSKAAECIFLSQPSVSLYVSSLEKELNTQLIIRSTKDVMPTQTGRIFYEYAKNILALKDKAAFAVQKQLDKLQGEIQILASSVPAQYILPEMLVKFSTKYPHLSYSVKQSDTGGVIAGVIAQECEFGIVGGKIDTSKCYYEMISSESLVMIAPYQEEYVSKPNFKLHEIFATKRFITREEGSGTRQCYEDFLFEQGIKLNKNNTVATFSNTQSIIQAVSKGLGVAIVSAVAAKDYIAQKSVIPLNLGIDLPKRSFYFVFKKEAIISPQVKLFIDLVHEYFGGIE